jgi:hypothetical protein
MLRTKGPEPTTPFVVSIFWNGSVSATFLGIMKHSGVEVFDSAS